MGNKKRRKVPAYGADDAAVLKSAGIPHKVRQPIGTLNAVRQVNEAQRGRITHVSTQERVVEGSDGRIDTCRAAMVQQVHPVLAHLNPTAQAGWLHYAEMWDAAVPMQCADYGSRAERVQQGRDADADPAWLRARTRLREFEKRLGSGLARSADRFMRQKDTMRFNAGMIGMLNVEGEAIHRVVGSET